MIWFLKMLVLGHVHFWEETGRDNLINETWDSKPGKTGELSYCRCKTCGKPTVFKLEP